MTQTMIQISKDELAQLINESVKAAMEGGKKEETKVISAEWNLDAVEWITEGFKKEFGDWIAETFKLLVAWVLLHITFNLGVSIVAVVVLFTWFVVSRKVANNCAKIAQVKGTIVSHVKRNRNH